VPEKRPFWDIESISETVWPGLGYSYTGSDTNERSVSKSKLSDVAVEKTFLSRANMTICRQEELILKDQSIRYVLLILPDLLRVDDVQ
jgi:hypothetical protein